VDAIPIKPTRAHLLVTRVDYTDGDPELYALFAAIATGDEARQIETTAPESMAAAVSNGSERGVLYSALWDQAFLRLMLDAVLRRKRFRGEDGEFSGVSLRGIKGDAATLEPAVNVQPQSNTSIAYGDRFMLKLYRRLEAGVDPEREIGQRLMAAGEFPRIAPVAGYLEYRPGQGEPMPLGILHHYVAHETDGWHYTLDAVSQFFERAQNTAPPSPELLGPYLQTAKLIGQRTAEMHRAIDRSGFGRLPFGDAYRQELYYSISSRAAQTLRRLPSANWNALEPAIGRLLRRFRDTKMAGSRMRVHGNYHLGELLYTGTDFAVIDFEGDPSRRLNERRSERSVLWDVVSMLCSLHHAAHSASFGNVPGVNPGAANESTLQRADFWSLQAGEKFLSGYFATLDSPELLPQSPEHTQTLMKVLTLQRQLMLAEALYERSVSLGHRTAWPPNCIGGRGVSPARQ
jgi:maltose alpha-D-glucosyltransferase/alpha-amylase